VPGIYVSLFASAQTQRRLAPVLDLASKSIPATTPQELHITLAHDKETELLPQELSTEACPLREFKVMALCAEHWTTKNGNSIVVASLISPELHDRWRFWQAWGLHWDFPTFRPHFSLTAPLVGMPRSAVSKWCRLFNEAVQGLEYSFTNEYVQDVKEGGSWYDPKADSDEEDSAEPSEEANMGGSGGKRPASSKGRIALKKVPVHRPKLSEEEEEAMRRHGFNSVGVEHRIHDQRSTQWERESDEVDKAVEQLKKAALEGGKGKK
jgi:hypothetical protein